MGKYRGLGLMSGTSLDGLDVVCCDFEEIDDSYKFEVVAEACYPFDERWKSRLTHLMTQSAEVYAKTHVYFGHWLGKHIQSFINDKDLKPDFVSLHGHTIFHQPDKTFTAQIGDGETVAAYVNCPVVTNFRNKDVAMGGEGAPLVPMGEQYLFPDYPLFLNLGGFCNLSLGGMAYDIAPCNGVLNLLAKTYDPTWEYDEGGKMARSGTLDSQLLDQFNALSYYQKEPPKSLGWEWVNQHILPILRSSEATLPDMAHTFTIHVAQQVRQAIARQQISGLKMMITGGGRHNLFLMEHLQSTLNDFQIDVDQTVSRSWIDFKEAIVFAFLGLRVLTGKTTTLAKVTGASSDLLTGSIHLPGRGGYTMWKG